MKRRNRTEAGCDYKNGTAFKYHSEITDDGKIVLKSTFE
jgi:hypothetical protein